MSGSASFSLDVDFSQMGLLSRKAKYRYKAADSETPAYRHVFGWSSRCSDAGGCSLPPTHSQRWSRVSAPAAIKRLVEVHDQASEESEVANGVAAIASRLMDYYRRRMEALTGDNPNHAKAGVFRAAEIKMWLEAVRAERHEINRLIEERELDQEAARTMLHKLDNTEPALQGN